jgi:cyclopropane-fatty-acyl-phospholipid synthase
MRSSKHQALVLDLLDRYLESGQIAFHVSNQILRVGRGATIGPFDGGVVALRVRHARFFSRVLTYGTLGLGEAYIDGDFDVEQGALDEFLTLLLKNRIDDKLTTDWRLLARVAMLRLANLIRGPQESVRFHYDQGDELFEAFLDPTLTYSCGYAVAAHDTLEQLQLNKLERICQKLALKPGDRLLDIGCGYGGLLVYAAKTFGITGLGITISKRHFERASKVVTQEGLDKQVRVALQNYDQVQGEFDKIVSVGMMEHLQPRQYRRYFACIAKFIHPKGIGLVHTIGNRRGRTRHDPFIQKYIFPSSGQPQLSAIATELERQRLMILDVENIIRHYSLTAARWLERFRANKHFLDQERYDDRFARMWEYYLCCGIAAARASDATVYQVLFTPDRAAQMSLKRV